ncbi:hypothetical protein [Pontibacter mangrovi]|uniref:Uncharacterized protein n=1 Tax=Pontibacter mangrovi TaxID=2589816 RepID=A0A501WBX6_9BACT|nr:hypothetical protein [Pontibacter mangrovi]TPE45574.1 hypothetical protein FJM65_06000 [Pontibacter mangrovi]
MTRYLLYFLTGVATATVILFFRGYVSVPHNVYSDVALLAGMVLFSTASWVTLFRIKIGTLLALFCSLAMVPWLVRAGLRVWDAAADVPQVLQVVHAVMAALVFFTLVVSSRYVFSRGSWGSGTAAPGPVLKVLLTLLPMAVLAGWLLVQNKL